MPRLPCLQPQLLSVTLKWWSFVVFFVVVCRYLLADFHDPYKCYATLNEGQWLDPPRSDSAQRPFSSWQPPGCLLHDYKHKEIRSCVGNQKILFIGDSTVRQIFWATAKKLDRNNAQYQREHPPPDGNLNFTHNDVVLQFIWDPFLNSTELMIELRSYRETWALGYANTNDDGKNGAAVVLIGGGLSFARHFEAIASVAYREALEKIRITAFPPKAKQMKAERATSGFQGTGDGLFFMPVEEPLYDRLSPSRQLTIVPHKIDPMNKLLGQFTREQDANVLWAYSRMAEVYDDAYEESGLHVVENIANHRSDLLLNLVCNAKRPVSDGQSLDGTCCMNYRPLGWVQRAAFGLAAVLSLLMAVKSLRDNSAPQPRASRLRDSILTIILVLAYAYFADRTHMFTKNIKFHKQYDFALLLCVSLLVGILGLKKIDDTAGIDKVPQVPQARKSGIFLSRNLTDEWKGWMQAYMLIFTYTDSIKELWVNEIFQLIITSHLFLAGFGHTMYFYRTGDYSLRRVATKLLRINFLCSTLPYVMHTAYPSYFLAPLITFWFLVVYITLRAGNSRNGTFAFVLGKIVSSAVSITLFINLHGPLELTFDLLRRTCHIKWDSQQWRDIVGYSPAIVFIGMLVAIINIRASDALKLSHERDLVTVLIQRYFREARIILIAAAAIVLPSFWILTRRAPNIADFNWWLPYIAFLPVVSFAVLRNSTWWLRSYYSATFAWLGRCSFETYALSYHIWLAVNSKGLLSTGLFVSKSPLGQGQWKDFVVLTPIFLFGSWRVSLASRQLIDWFTGNSEEAQAWEPETGRRKSHDYQLPAFTEQNNGHVAPPHHVRTLSMSEIPVPGRLQKFVLNSLTGRMLVLFGVMWVLNWTYT